VIALAALAAPAVVAATMAMGAPDVQLGLDSLSPAGVDRPMPQNRDTEAKVCKVTSHTGSRLNAVRICRTPEEWSEIAARNRKSLENVQKRGAMGAQGSFTSDRGVPGG
jgi:hypothetical protein